MSAFDTMRASLVARGLIGADGCLTAAGMAYTDDLMATLRHQLPAGGHVPAVDWSNRL